MPAVPPVSGCAGADAGGAGCVWASAVVYRKRVRAVTAAPRKGKILRRETNFDVMFNLLDFGNGGAHEHSTGPAQLSKPAGGYGSRAAIGTGARSIGSTLLPARRSAVMKSRPVPRASPSAMPADCGRCRRPDRGISTTIHSLVCSNRFSRWSSRSTSLGWSETDYVPSPSGGVGLRVRIRFPPAASQERTGPPRYAGRRSIHQLDRYRRDIRRLGRQRR